MSSKDHRVESPVLTADPDLLAQWAGEEFVAAGRAEEQECKVHRRRALHLADALYELRRQK